MQIIKGEVISSITFNFFSGLVSTLTPLAPSQDMRGPCACRRDQRHACNMGCDQLGSLHLSWELVPGQGWPKGQSLSVPEGLLCTCRSVRNQCELRQQCLASQGFFEGYQIPAWMFAAGGCLEEKENDWGTWRSSERWAVSLPA